MTTEERQREVCRRYNAEFLDALPSMKAGVADDVWRGVSPLNGLRHIPSNGTSGWYIWAGEEPSQEDDYFKPLHIGHLNDTSFDMIRFLGLAPGWRFQIADDHEEVWFDPSLL